MGVMGEWEGLRGSGCEAGMAMRMGDDEEGMGGMSGMNDGGGARRVVSCRCSWVHVPARKMYMRKSDRVSADLILRPQRRTSRGGGTEGRGRERNEAVGQ